MKHMTITVDVAVTDGTTLSSMFNKVKDHLFDPNNDLNPLERSDEGILRVMDWTVEGQSPGGKLAICIR